MPDSAQERGPFYRNATLRGFLPLSDEPTLSTRGQKLPGLLSHRSNTNMNEMRQDMVRRASIFWSQTTTGGASITEERDLEAARRPSTDEDYLTFGNARKRERSRAQLDRKLTQAVETLMSEEMRSQRLIGNSNPRYKWAKYYKTEEQLKGMKKPLRQYYERCNSLVQQYIYIDRLLDSSLPHNLIQEYNNPEGVLSATIPEESGEANPQDSPANGSGDGSTLTRKVKRTAKDIYTLPAETTPLLRQSSANSEDDEDGMKRTDIPDFVPEEEEDSGAPVVTVAIYLNLAANTILLILKIIATVLTSSISVLASLVDAALDFLSTAIVWTTTRLISSGHTDTYKYPVGQRRLEPIGVLVFSVVMITSFVQVGIDAFQKLTGSDHEVVALSVTAIVIMASTVVIKFGCWLWCRLIKNSSVQALAQDAMTDVIFNVFSIIFPLVGYYAHVWWLDPLGGLLLSLYVIFSWSQTSKEHILNLTGQTASKDERAVLLYLTMRFAKTIKQIQGLSAYHAGDKLNVEADIVLAEDMSLRDSHDLCESLQYVLESVPGVERAFVHADYSSENLPNHMRK